jgi:Cu/Ag efflux pump CusA
VLKGIITFALTRRPIVLLGLLVFIAAGLAALSRLNIEAYPNPAPVILEITAQSAGQSAEEMERYYTIPLEVGLAATPGVDVIRSTSFYGLSFVRVVFQYGVDYYFALTQTAARYSDISWSDLRTSGSPTCAPSRIGSCNAGCSQFRAWSRSTPGEARPRNMRSKSI